MKIEIDKQYRINLLIVVSLMIIFSIRASVLQWNVLSLIAPTLLLIFLWLIYKSSHHLKWLVTTWSILIIVFSLSPILSGGNLAFWFEGGNQIYLLLRLAWVAIGIYFYVTSSKKIRKIDVGRPEHSA